MDRLTQQRQAIRDVLHDHAAIARKTREQHPDDPLTPPETIAICDETNDNYLLVNVGWKAGDRIHSILTHLRIIDGNIHVEWNGTEDLIEDIIDRGIPESDFVCPDPDRATKSTVEAIAN